jgi:hypothetical protein
MDTLEVAGAAGKRIRTFGGKRGKRVLQKVRPAQNVPEYTEQERQMSGGLSEDRRERKAW